MFAGDASGGPFGHRQREEGWMDMLQPNICSKTIDLVPLALVPLA
jgi:hypothetical protein